MHPDVGDQALVAIVQGIKEEHPVCYLEHLGASQRLINLLEKEGFRTLESLMHAKKAELMRCKNFGEKQFKILIDCLSRYHQLDFDKDDDD
jgi:DNA-directed RNA polymerase alpha subunit